jgi:ATP synthase protein I
VKKIGVLVTIPFVLAVPPIVGWFIGKWLDEVMHTAPYLKYTLLILGLCAAGRECYRLIKEFGDAT